MRDHQVSRRAWLRLALAPALTLSSPLLGLAEPVDSSDDAARQQIPFRTAEVLSADGQSFVVTWSAPAAAGRVAVYARSTPDLDLSSGAGRRVGDAGPAGRLRSAPNFRDVGGYRTLDGRWVRMGQVYRSDQLDRLSDADLAQIASLKPALVVDLRTDAERRSGPDRTPPSATPLVADVMASFQPDMAAVMRIKAPQDAIAFMTKANRQFVSGTSALTAYATLLDRLDGADGVVVYHCTAGKDRTGWASAVLLTILRSPRETIMADYLASNAYLADKNKATLATLPPDRAAAFEPMLTVRPDYLEAAFAEVQTRYGSFDRYLSQGLGLDATALAQLRSRFLVGAPKPQTPIGA
jgi:protein-tyrosine phosphatase